MSDEDITVGFSVNHGLAGTNSEVVGFTVCSNAQIYLDLNGNGQWSDEAPWRESNDCDGGSVRVSAL